MVTNRFMEEYTFIGDSIIENYNVDFESKQISMFCVQWYGQDNSERGETTVIFDNVLTHLFVGTNNKGNILFDIQETTLEDLYRQFGDILNKYHFDFSSKANLDQIIKADNYKIYIINSSFGLYGLVISKNINFLSNDDDDD